MWLFATSWTVACQAPLWNFPGQKSILLCHQMIFVNTIFQRYIIIFFHEWVIVYSSNQLYETWSLCFISGRVWRAGRELEFWSLLLTRTKISLFTYVSTCLILGNSPNHKAINHVIIFFYLSIRVYPGRRVRIGILFSQGINLELKFGSHGTKFGTLNLKNVCLVQRQRKSG